MPTEDQPKMLFQATRQKTQEEIAKENKEAKENKKNVKEIIKTNKEVIEEIVKSNAEASARVEDKLTNIGNEINRSNTELQNTIAKLTETLVTIAKNNENTNKIQQPSIREQQTQSPPSQDQPSNTWDKMPALKQALEINDQKSMIESTTVKSQNEDQKTQKNKKTQLENNEENQNDRWYEMLRSYQNETEQKLQNQNEKI